MEQETVLIYYTCLTHDEKIEQLCREQLLKANLPIISVSRNEPIDFGDNIVVEGERGAITMHLQILAGLEYAASKGYKQVFLCESDVLYHPSHFDFTASDPTVFYYNVNVWKYHIDDKKFYWTDDMQQVSGSCASLTKMLEFYTRRNKQFAETGFDRHYEASERFGEKTENWMSAEPNICIRHDKTLTRTKKSIADFKNKNKAKGWKVADSVEGWDLTKLK